jgi:Tol biopolymer transport system component
MFTRRTAAALAATLILALALTAQADAKKPAPPDDPPGPITNPALVYAARVKIRGAYEMAVMVITADGSARQKLTSFENGAGTPTWKPDGSRIAFRSMYENPDPYPYWCHRISAINSDGTGETVLWDECADPNVGDGPSGPIDWSADNQIAFSDLYYIWTLDPDTGATQNLFPTQSSWDTWEGSTHLILNQADSPTWSPDGRLAFRGQIFDEGGAWIATDIFVYDPEMGTTTNLTYTPGESILEEYIDWSPDGQYITYNAPGVGIYKVSPSGPWPGELVLASGRSAHLSPGSLYLALIDDVVTKKGSHTDLFRADADGSNLVNLTDDDGLEGEPDWNPAWVNDL